MSTMKEIARAAGVSTSTVSRALADDDRISEATRQRIAQIARQLAYRPNWSAKALAGKRTQLIGMMVPEITGSLYAQLFTQIESWLHPLGYELMIGTTDYQHRKAIRNVEIFMERAVDGIIYADATMMDDCGSDGKVIRSKIETMCARANLPLVFLTTSGSHGMLLLIQYLAGLGHKSVGLIGESYSNRDGLSEFKKALAECGISCNEKFIRIEGRERFEAGGYMRMKELLAGVDRPTAVLAARENMAIGAMKALHEAGMRVPEDISLVGFGPVRESAYLVPGLTIVSPRIEEKARRAMELLVERIEAGTENHSGEMKTVTFNVLYPELVIRGSACAPDHDDHDYHDADRRRNS